MENVITGKVSTTEQRVVDTGDYEKITIYEGVTLPILEITKDDDDIVTAYPLDMSTGVSVKHLEKCIKNTRAFAHKSIKKALDEKEESIREWAKDFQEIELVVKSPSKGRDF